jgi:hypothetical protein
VLFPSHARDGVIRRNVSLESVVGRQVIMVIIRPSGGLGPWFFGEESLLALAVEAEEGKIVIKAVLTITTIVS